MKIKHIALYAAAFLATACAKTPDYDATGIFEATTVTISAETSGRLLSIPVSEGDTVAPGRQVALVDTVLLSLQRAQLASQRGAAESSSPHIAAQAAALRARVEHQEREYERYRALLADGAATPKQVDDAEAALKTLRGELDGLLSTLGNSRASISGNAAAIEYQREQVAEQIARSVVVSPVGGTVLAKYAEAGEYAVPGKPLLKIADLDRVYLRCYFTADRLADVKLGQSVTVTADYGGGKLVEYPGTVTWIADESEFTPKSIQTPDSRANLVYAAKVAVRNDGRLKLGQYGEVKL